MIFINKIKGLIRLDYDDDGVSEPGIDFHLHRERFDAVDDGGASMDGVGVKINLFRAGPEHDPDIRKRRTRIYNRCNNLRKPIVSRA